MKLFSSKKLDTQTLLIVFLLFLIIIIAIDPYKYSVSSYNGLMIWATAVLPGLLPFCFITKILSHFKQLHTFTRPLGFFTKRLYNTSGLTGYIFFMSIISGYPLGSKLISEFYKNRVISEGEAHRTCSFASTSGPMFILGTVGAIMLINTTAGIIIMVSHLLGAVINGLFYRNYKKKEQNCSVLTDITQSNNILNDSMYNTITSCLIVGGFITFAFVLIDILLNLNLLYPLIYIIDLISGPLGAQIGTPLAAGLIELTRGCMEVSVLHLSPALAATICSILISFGGVSVHLQSMVFLKDCNIKYKFFLLTKTTHATTSGLLAILLSILLL